MSLDLLSALAIMGFASAVAGALLLISWLHHRSVPALVLWALAFVLTAIAAALIGARGKIPDVWSVVGSNAILALAYGCMWSGARIFEGRTPSTLGTFLGALVWLFACFNQEFYASPVARLTLITAIGMTYSLLAAAEFWGKRDEHLASRRLIMGLLFLNAVALPFRIPLSGPVFGTEFDRGHLLTFITLESVLVSMCGAYLLGSLVKERVANSYKQASLVDPLTGTANRRAFLKQGPRLVRRCQALRQSTALLLFDLDRFKVINDTFGHAAGDEVLIAFCRIAGEHLRPTDFFTRIGGEEFACLLPGASSHEAAAIAERVRAAFERSAHDMIAEPFPITVSIGISVTGEHCRDLDCLLDQADAALYRAKQSGRNRVELADYALAGWVLSQQ